MGLIKYLIADNSYAQMNLLIKAVVLFVWQRIVNKSHGLSPTCKCIYVHNLLSIIMFLAGVSLLIHCFCGLSSEIFFLKLFSILIVTFVNNLVSHL